MGPVLVGFSHTQPYMLLKNHDKTQEKPYGQ